MSLIRWSLRYFPHNLLVEINYLGSRLKFVTMCNNENKQRKSNTPSLFLTGAVDSDHGVISHLKIHFTLPALRA